MAGFRRPKYLTCFYCGKRTSTPFSVGVRHFDCPSCDATNYLDADGEITDPPVATTSSSAPTRQYASHRVASPKTASSSELFCATCLKNQHLFTASLAQYFPDDPDDPEYAALEKGYFQFRKGLEKRYPQMCAECEPKVLGRIQQAGYTAKTDHLRRMIGRSKQMRASEKTWLHAIHRAGRWLWIGAFLLQLSYQLAALCSVAAGLHWRYQATAETMLEDEIETNNLIQVMQSLSDMLPMPAPLYRWMMLAGVLSSVWNPRFVHTIKGMTKQVKGLGNWYALQTMLLILRFMPRLSVLPQAQPSDLAMHIAAHGAATLLSLLIGKSAYGSVRLDMSPLFGRASSSSLPSSPPASSPQPHVRQDTKSLVDILDEISAEPSSSPPIPSPLRESTRSSGAFASGGTSSFGEPTQSSTQTGNNNTFLDMQGLRAPSTRPQNLMAPQYEEDMDWTPTQTESQHRAFQTQNQSPLKSFGEAPTTTNRGAFWYKVPAAPITPAQRVRNPPNPPRLRQSPATQETVAFRGTNKPLGAGARGEGHEAASDISFAPPSFFPPATRSDPRNSLSDLFGKSFSLGPAAGDDNEPAAPRSRRSTNAAQRQAELAHGSNAINVALCLVLGACLAAWVQLHALPATWRHILETGVPAIFAASSIWTALQFLGRLSVHQDAMWWLTALGAVIAVVKGVLLGQLGYQIWQMGPVDASSQATGAALMGLEIGQQIWALLT